MHYRDKVNLDDGKPLRANVYVISNATRFANVGQFDKVGIIVSFPHKKDRPITSVSTVTWMGDKYTVQGKPVPIMALGRLDHWEISAERITGA